ncbi:MAG TPA: RNA ligase (ATP) [archaeon]|nr:RNA ligase (ATP) [archaeon]
MRKLATIERITKIAPIDGADKIELASILGWNVVIKKGEYNVNDLVVYCQIDSILPEKPEFEFLRNSKFRIRTVKLRGQISQGICFSLAILPNEIQEYIHKTKNIVGYDVTEILGIIKYEPPIPAELSGEVKGKLPSFFQKTDEDRIQILPDIPLTYGGQSFIVTEKLDGSSCSFYYNNGDFGVCGRKWEYVESETNTMWKFAKENDLKNKFRNLGRNLAFQGEVIGENIQKNKYKLKGQTVRFFRIFDIDRYEYLPYEEMCELINELKLQTVPIIDWNYKLPNTMEEILEYAVGKSKLNPQTEREGLVFVKYELKNQGRLSFKAISNKFLIDNKE